MVASGAKLAQLLGLDPIESRVEGFRRKVPVRFFRRRRQQNMSAMITKATTPTPPPMMIDMVLSLMSGFDFVTGVDVDVDVGLCLVVFASEVDVACTVLGDVVVVAFGL